MKVISVTYDNRVNLTVSDSFYVHLSESIFCILYI